MLKPLQQHCHELLFSLWMKKGRDFLKTIRAKFITIHSHNQAYKKMDTSERYCYNPTLNWKKEVEDYFIKAYGSEHFSRISKALTRPSCYTCIRVNTLKSTSDAVVEKLLSILQGAGLRGDDISISKTDVIATAELDVGHKKGSFSKELNPDQLPNCCPMADLRLFGDGDPIEAGLQSFPINKCQLPGLDYVLFVKGSGPHTIDYCCAPNESLKEVIVSRKCAEAVLRGAQVFVPGVLACSAHVEKGDKVAVSVAVEQPLDNGWGVGITRGTVLQGLPTDPHYLERRGLYIGQGTAMLSRAGTFRASEGIAVDMSLMTDRVFNLPSLHDVLGGEIFLQNLPSIITAHALDPQPGDRVLDMCAAPGGKTTAIAILMKDEGEVIAADRSHNKVLEIKKLAAEMGLNCITAYRLDALKAVCQSNESIGSSAQLCKKDSACVTSEIESKESSLLEDTAAVTANPVHTDLQCKESVSDEKTGQGSYLSKAEIRKNTRRMRNGPGRNHTLGGRVENSKGFPPSSFDRILLDPPCSALGLRPRLFAGEVTIESLRGHRTYQRKMFDQAVQLVRPGGVIVYSTCTINPGENEGLVRYALDKYKFLSLAPQHPRIGGPGLVGHCELYDGQRVEEWLRPGEEELVQRFDPSSPLDTIGFFIAKFTVGQKDT